MAFSLLSFPQWSVNEPVEYGIKRGCLSITTRPPQAPKCWGYLMNKRSLTFLKLYHGMVYFDIYKYCENDDIAPRYEILNVFLGVATWPRLGIPVRARKMFAEVEAMKTQVAKKMLSILYLNSKPLFIIISSRQGRMSSLLSPDLYNRETFQCSKILT